MGYSQSNQMKSKSTELPKPLRNLIKACRYKCSNADFTGAFGVLRKSTNAAALVIIAENVRIHILKGDLKSARAVLEDVPESDSDTKDGNYRNLLRIQKAFLDVSMDGKLAEALNICSDLWVSCAQAGSDSEAHPEVLLQIAYYCLEVYQLGKLYGEGLQYNKVSPDFNQIWNFIRKFSVEHEGLEFEVSALLELFADPPRACEILEALSNLPKMRRKPAKIGTLLSLAQIYGSTGEVDSLLRTLDRAERLISKIGHKTGRLEAQVLRFRYTSDGLNNDDITRGVGKLLEIARTLRDWDYPDKRLKALELAAELHCQLPVTPQNEGLGIQINDEIQHLTNNSGDGLGLVLNQFRRCDLLSYFGSQWALASELRGKLLESSWSLQNPYFGRFYEQQCADFSDLKRDASAIHNAEKYLQYCERSRDEETQSGARCLLFRTLLQTGLMSEEKRITHLESLRSELERAIEKDGVAGFRFGQIENMMLLVEVIDELGRLEEEVDERWKAALEILDRAQKISEHLPNNERSIAIRCEISGIRLAAIANMELSIHSPTLLDATSVGDLTSSQISQSTSPATERRRIIKRSDLVQQLVIAQRNCSYPLFRKLLAKVRDELEWVEKDGHILDKQFLYLFVACVTYLLVLRNGEAALPSWHDAGIRSRKEGFEIVLCHIEKVFETQELLSRNLAGDTKFELLTSKQAHFTSLAGLLDDITMAVCYELDNPDLTWKWAQKTKARGLSEVVLSSGSNQTRSLPEDLKSEVTFEDLLWASTASINKVSFVDWTTTSKPSEPFLLSVIQFEKGEEGRQFRRCKQAKLQITAQEILEWKEAYLNTRRLQDDDAELYLEKLGALVEPLEDFTIENELLVLCPTAPFHNIPLHALKVGGKLLLERNPVVYIPTFSVLIRCLRYLEAPGPEAEAPLGWKAAVMGAYEDMAKDSGTVGEREIIYGSLRALAQDLGTKEILGPHLKSTDFQREASEAKLIHFHGHGSFDQHDISKQSLILGASRFSESEQSLSISNILNLELNAPHITLIACETGIQDFSLGGDELLGILSAFIVAGATSVIGALWNIKSESGLKFTRGFYNNFLHEQPVEKHCPVVNLAVALQRAALEIRSCRETRAPYHWAPFVLHGAWFCQKKPRT